MLLEENKREHHREPVNVGQEQMDWKNSAHRASSGDKTEISANGNILENNEKTLEKVRERTMNRTQDMNHSKSACTELVLHEEKVENGDGKKKRRRRKRRVVRSNIRKVESERVGQADGPVPDGRISRRSADGTIVEEPDVRCHAAETAVQGPGLCHQPTVMSLAASRQRLPYQ